jgi:branched-chain amino acid transport system ATP-binding protein
VNDSAARVLLRTERLCRSFGSLMAVRDVSLQIRQGEIHAIIGPNGAGKTTLLNVLSGELLPTSGSLLFEDRDVTGWRPDQLARAGLGRSFQHSSTFAELPTFENVRLAAQVQLPTSMRFFRPASHYREINEGTQSILSRFGLASLAMTRAGEISHGAQRQLEIAMLSAIAPKLMLLDEPTSGMGKAETRELIEVLRQLAEYHTLVLVEHDMDVVFTLAQRITVLVNGEVMATGAPEEVRRDRKVRAAYLGERDGAPNP